MMKHSLLLFLVLLCLGACVPQEQSVVLPQESATESAQSGETSLADDSLCGKTVILDAGHGFGDVGCSFPDGAVYEKDVTLILAQKIGDALQLRGINVLYTHDGSDCLTKSRLDAHAQTLDYDLDGFLRRLVETHSGRTGDDVQATLDTFYDGVNENDLFGVYERCYYVNLLARQHAVSLFVSVHVNANESCDTLTGFELYCCADTPHADASGDAMLELQGALAYRFLQKETRIRTYGWDDAYVVTKYTDVPSVLIESGYATTPSDARDLQNEAWQNKFAKAVADGIVRYLQNT